MTKADIVERICTTTGRTKADGSEILETVLEIMKDTIQAGEKIKVAGFGNFEIRQKNNRTGRNPQTGEAITIAARRILTFKCSSLLKQAVNR